MPADDDDYLDGLAVELGFPTWDHAINAAAWRSGWRWFGIGVGMVLTFFPLGYFLGSAW